MGNVIPDFSWNVLVFMTGYWVRRNFTRHRPQALRHEGVPPSRGESSGVSHRPGASVQPDPLPAPGPERGHVWGGSRGRSPPDLGLDAQPTNPDFGGLSVHA